MTAVYDADQERAEALASQHNGCRVAKSALDVVHGAPSAVFICSPPSSRGPIELAAIDAQIPFLVEKPVGVSAAQATPILEKLSGSNLVHAVGYQNRCRRSVEHAKQILTGRTILAISAFWVGRKYLVPWWLRSEDSGGPINEQATHLIDMSRHLCGEIAGFSCCLGAVEAGTKDVLSAAIALRFKSGAFGSLIYSCEAKDKQIGIRVITDDGGLTLSGWDLVLTQNEIDSSGLETQVDDVFVVDTKRFLDAVAENRPESVSCTFKDAWQTQTAVDQIRASNGIQWRAL
jgi:predicted dehydrogenase